MAVRIKRIMLWRTEVENRPGALATVLEPLAHTATDLHVVMGYSNPGQESRAVIEVYPGAGRKAVSAARAGGFSASPTPVLLLEGENKPGLGYTIANAIAWAGINIRFLVAQVAGKKYSAIVGFDSDVDADKGGSLIKKATAGRKT